MTNIYSARLAGPVTIPFTTGAVLFTVPQGEVWVVKEAVLHNPHPTAQAEPRFHLQVAGGAFTQFFWVKLGGGETLSLRARWTLNAGEAIRGNASGATTHVVTLFGYKFIG